MSTPALQNVYYERKTGTAKPCYICKRPTQTVLATIKTEDFLYTCDGHLTDTGFASLISPPAATGPSAEDIRKVISEYEAKQAKKAEKDKDKGKDGKDDKDTEKDKDKDKGKSSNTASPIPAVTAPPAPTHRKFALHRQVFDMRKAELRKKEQGVKAKEVGKGLPQVPRGAF